MYIFIYIILRKKNKENDNCYVLKEILIKNSALVKLCMSFNEMFT